jgi:hypothetical protein
MLGQAMYAGDLDEPRARAFTDWTRCLSGDQAAQVCFQLLPQAGGWTVGALIDQIKRAALAIDPAYAERRYNEAVGRRRVVGTRREDGTATVSGIDLPVDRAAAGVERIDQLARAAKQAGDRRAADHIRADLFLGMLDGTFETLTDTQIITHILAHPFIDPQPPEPAPTDTPTPEPGPAPAPASEPAPGPAREPDPEPGPAPEPSWDLFPASEPGCDPPPEPVPWPTSPLDPSDVPTEAALSGDEQDARYEQHAHPMRRVSPRYG